MRKPTARERDVLKAVTQYLDAKGYVYLRIHPVRPVGKQGAVRFVPTAAGQVGAPDLLVFGWRWVLAVEVKATTGKQSAAQGEWEAKLRALCHSYRIVRSIEDLEKAISEMPMSYRGNP